AGTLADLTAWKAEREEHGADGDGPFVCSVHANRHGHPLQRAAVRQRFLSACKVLGLNRLRTLTIHHGRHTFISHALAGGHLLAEVRWCCGFAAVRWALPRPTTCVKGVQMPADRLSMFPRLAQYHGYARFTLVKRPVFFPSPA